MMIRRFPAWVLAAFVCCSLTQCARTDVPQFILELPKDKLLDRLDAFLEITLASDDPVALAHSIGVEIARRQSENNATSGQSFYDVIASGRVLPPADNTIAVLPLGENAGHMALAIFKEFRGFTCLKEADLRDFIGRHEVTYGLNIGLILWAKDRVGGPAISMPVPGDQLCQMAIGFYASSCAFRSGGTRASRAPSDRQGRAERLVN